jgi:hypothetical protein
MVKPLVRALLKLLFRVRVEGETSHFRQPRPRRIKRATKAMSR